MQQFNILIAFVFCVAIVFFSLQNPTPVSVQFLEGVTVQAPLALELLFAMGLGATLAWMFSVWMRWLRLLESRQSRQQIRTLDDRVQELEKTLEQYQAQLEIAQQGCLPPATEPQTQDA